MNYPDTLLEWLSCGVGGLLLLLGLLLAACNCYILFFNILHQWIRKDGKHSSFIPLIPAICIFIGGMLLSPVLNHLSWLCLLDVSLLNLIFLPVYVVWRAMLHLWRVICCSEK